MTSPNEIQPACAPFDSDLSALHDGELTTARAAELRAHLAACAPCAARFAALGRIDAALGELAAAPPAAERLARLRLRALEGLREEAARAPAPASRRAGRARRPRAPLRLRRWRAPLALGATAAAAAALLLVLRTPAPDPTQEPIVVAEQAVPASPAEIAAAARAARDELPALAPGPRGAAVAEESEVAALRETTPPPAGTPAAAPIAQSDAGAAALEAASDDELALADALRALPELESPADLAVVEELELLESLAALDAPHAKPDATPDIGPGGRG